MSTEFPDVLVKLIEQKILTLDFVKDWALRSNNQGKLDNLSYIEILDRLKAYERTEPQ